MYVNGIIVLTNIFRSDASAVSVNGQVYIVGGFDGVHCHGSMEVYIPERNQWIRANSSMHYARSGVKAVQIGGVIMVRMFNLVCLKSQF